MSAGVDEPGPAETSYTPMSADREAIGMTRAIAAVASGVVSPLTAVSEALVITIAARNAGRLAR